MDKYNKSKAEPWSKDEKYRDRSRSPQYSSRSPQYSSSRDHNASLPNSKHHREEPHRRKRRSRTTSSSSSSSNEELVPKNKSRDAKAPPLPPLISKISMNLKPNMSASKSGSSIQLKLNAPAKKPVVPLAKPSVASAFNDDSDDEVEEMPAEAKMRMRNIGKNTPTSSGPNSFGKTAIGFVDSKKIFEKKMQQMLKDMSEK